MMPQYSTDTAAPWNCATVGCSNTNMQTVDSTDTVKNCTKLSWMPSSRGLNRLTSKICSVNKNAQTSSCHSPPVRARVSRPARHSRYSPTTLAATHAHSLGPGRLPSNAPHTGTSTTYSAVMNPALAVLVVPMPICCAADAANSAVPHKTPPTASVLPWIHHGRRWPRRCWAVRRTASSPSKNAQASQLRPAKNV